MVQSLQRPHCVTKGGFRTFAARAGGPCRESESRRSERFESEHLAAPPQVRLEPNPTDAADGTNGRYGEAAAST